MKNIRTARTTTPTDREIVITRIFDTPRAVLFEAWTDPEHVAHWWDPKRRAARRLRNRPTAERSLSLGPSRSRRR